MKKIMFIASVGGHLTQLLELSELFKQYDSVLITEKIDITKDLKKKYKTEYLIYGSRKFIISYIFIFFYNVIKSLFLFIKHNPQIIITTGAHTAVPLCYIGWLFRRKVIYIESFAKSNKPNFSGKIIYPIASVVVVQWKSMLKHYPKAQYWGWIY